MKKVLITGGSRGIGFACLQKFCLSGYDVAFVYKNSDDKAKEIQNKYGAYPIKVDISDKKEILSAVSEALEHLGTIDILVNNAGVSRTGLFTDMKDDEWDCVLNTNLTSYAVFSREVSKIMIKNHKGCILNIGSVWGNYGASCEVAYSASKAGIRGLTLAMARELGPSGIRVNCVEPGVILTDMNNIFDEETKKELADSSALCRNGYPMEVAEAVYFLCSENASFITAQVLGVDGGFPLS